MSAMTSQSLATLDAIDERLEGVRSLIEDLFLASGDALVAASEITSQLLHSIDGIVTAMDDTTATQATSRLAATVARLRVLADTETFQQDGLNDVLLYSNAIGPLIADMQKTLNYLGTCAVATRIASAGMPEFAGFADDIMVSVTDASQQISAFAQRVSHLNDQLRSAKSGEGTAGKTLATTVPDVAGILLAASGSIDQRRRDLGKIAGQASKLALGVRTKVARVLSLIQIGDVTRQRIEHVQAGIRIFRSLARDGSPEDAASSLPTVIRLLLAQLRALARELEEGSRDIVITIDGFGRDADAILALQSGTTGLNSRGGKDAMTAIEGGIARSRALVGEIEAAGHQARAARTATMDTAGELLSSMGSIGNLRSVKDDIRCLSINAYLRCYRMGSKGRSVGVIATELSANAERLGASADGVLQRLLKMKDAAGMLASDAGTELADMRAELDAAASALGEISNRTDRYLEEMARQGEAVADRISGIAHKLDFRGTLGDALSTCVNMLQSQAGRVDQIAFNSLIIERFSNELYRLYTMASERDIHRSLIPILNDGSADQVDSCSKMNMTDDELFDDALF